MKLFRHQQEAIEFGVSIGANCALFHEPRCGKTRTALEIFKEFKAQIPELKMFVACPGTLITNVWKKQVASFTDLSFQPFKLLGCNIPDVTALNFESIISKKQLVQLKKLFTKHPYFCVIDESTKIAGPSSLITKTMLHLAPLFKYKMILTGSEVRNSELDYWGQISFIRPGLLPKSFFDFRRQFFELSKETKTGAIVKLPQQPQYMTWDYVRDIIAQSSAEYYLVKQATALLMKYQKQTYVPFPILKQIMQLVMSAGYQYKMEPSKRAQLINLVKPYCHWVKKADCFDMPPMVDQFLEIQLSKKECDIYRDMKNHLVAEVDGKKVAALVSLAKIMKLRQVSWGLFYDETKKPLVFGNSKLNALEDKLEELGNQQVIIYIEFEYETQSIVEMISKKFGADKVVTHCGSTENKDNSIKRFESGEALYLIAHPLTTAYGFDFAFATTMIFYSIDYSNELHSQSRERLLGHKQTKKCLYIYFLAMMSEERTIDHDMLDVLNGKKTLQEVIYALARNKDQVESISHDQKRVPGNICSQDRRQVPIGKTRYNDVCA
jgi:hypothetical protein